MGEIVDEEFARFSPRSIRDELLNETLFASLPDARVALGGWMKDCNTVRPHSAIGNVPPTTYAMLSDPAMQRDGSLRSCGSAPVRLLHRANKIQRRTGLYSHWMKDGAKVTNRPLPFRTIPRPKKTES